MFLKSLYSIMTFVLCILCNREFNAERELQQTHWGRLTLQHAEEEEAEDENCAHLFKPKTGSKVGRGSKRRRVEESASPQSVGPQRAHPNKQSAMGHTPTVSTLRKDSPEVGGLKRGRAKQ
jgi:hypothetical protein